MWCDAKWGKVNVRQGKAHELNLETLICNSLGRKVNTGKLNTNGEQESEHKAHPKQSYSKCLTAWDNDLWLVGPQEGARGNQKGNCKHVNCTSYVHQISEAGPMKRRQACHTWAITEAWGEVALVGCIVVDQQCRESNGKAKIMGYTWARLITGVDIVSSKLLLLLLSLQLNYLILVWVVLLWLGSKPIKKLSQAETQQSPSISWPIGKAGY